MVALKFNENINRRDLDGLVKLMTSDHTFINSEGEVHEGREVISARVLLHLKVAISPATPSLFEHSPQRPA